jgi:hypothetical protein
VPFLRRPGAFINTQHIKTLGKTPQISENSGNFPKKPVGRNFGNFREIFSGDSREFRKSPGTFPEIWGFLPERALWRRVHDNKTG